MAYIRLYCHYLSPTPSLFSKFVFKHFASVNVNSNQTNTLPSYIRVIGLSWKLTCERKHYCPTRICPLIMKQAPHQVYSPRTDLTAPAFLCFYLPGTRLVEGETSFLSCWKKKEALTSVGISKVYVRHTDLWSLPLASREFSIQFNFKNWALGEKKDKRRLRSIFLQTDCRVLCYPQRFMMSLIVSLLLSVSPFCWMFSFK